MESVLENEGRFWVRDALSDSDLNLLENASNKTNAVGERLEWSGGLSEAAGIESKLNRLAQSVMVGAKPVRFIAFNKTQGMNWALPWHQDRVIAVDRNVEIAGFNNWSQKSKIWHCEPPIDILETMMFARIHLDRADKTNGCLELAIGSHKYGKILSEDIDKTIANLPIEPCIANRGDVLFVKALTLHRSTASRSQSPRRTLRIDYANHDLPHPLSWAFVK